MKKNRKFLGVAAAALLAVAPVIASPAVANADVTLNNATQVPTTGVKYNPQFYYNGTAYINGSTIPTSISIKNDDTLTSIADLVNKSGIQIQSYENGQLISENIKVDAKYVKTELQKLSGVKFSLNKDNKEVVTGLPASGFNLELNYGTGASAAKVYLPVGVDGNQANVDVNLPIFKVTDGNGKEVSSRTFNIASGSTFNPTSFVTANGQKVVINAEQSKASSNYAAITVVSNPVDTTQAGRFYTVTLKATNAIGKTAELSYQVMIVSSGAETLQSDVPTYGLYVNNAIATGSTLKAGTKIYVGTETRTINNVSYTKISTTSKADADSNSSNLWVKTADLTKPAGDTNTKTLPVMVDSKAYDKDANYLGHMYYAYDDITIVPKVVTIKGKTYYKVANKDEYVRVTNITGTQRRLRHNAYIYWSSYRRTPGTGKMYRGETVTTYGGQMRFKNGKKYYRIEGCRNNNKRYIKAVNFY